MPAQRTRIVSEPPPYWISEPDGSGGIRLCFAIRSGGWNAALVAAGAAIVLTGLWGMHWLTDGGGLTVAGWVFLFLVPGGAVLFGVHVLGRMLWAQTEYVLSRDALTENRRSVWGSRSTTIARQRIAAITQNYTPPRKSEPHGSDGTWVTFIDWSEPGARQHDLALDGLGTVAEKQWLGPLLAEWAQVPLKRGFSDGFEEADPAELPPDD